MSRFCSIFLFACVSTLLAGCAFLPGFGFFETPTLYFLPVAQVANRVACELQDFVAEHRNDAAFGKHQWVLAQDDVKVVLTLATDEAGNASFSGINAAQLGFSSLAALIASQTSSGKTVPTLAAKLSAKRTKTVAMTFSVSPTPLSSDPRFVMADGKYKTGNCLNLETETPLNSLYLRDWLNNYFETINFSGNFPDYKNSSLTDTVLHSLRPLSPPPVPKQLKIQSVQLTTQILLAADISAGTTPNVLGNGTVFIVPINGLSLDYNPDYSQKIDITLNICEQKDQFCNPPTGPKLVLSQNLLDRQCRTYATLAPLLTVKPPRDYVRESDGAHMRCNKSGKYESIVN